MREATFDGKRFSCPFCGSCEMVYAEDQTATNKILAVESGVVQLCPDDEIDELAWNERLRCTECGESSALPEGFDTEFDDTPLEERIRRAHVSSQ